MSRPNLRLRREVRRLRSEGRIYRGRWMHVRIGDSCLPSLLISVRKRFGGAVSRNQARRRIRAIFRDLLPNGSSGNLILISIADAAGGTCFNELRIDLTSALSKFGLLDQ